MKKKKLCNLNNWLQYIEKIHLQNISFDLKKLKNIQAKLNLDFSKFVIIVGGTNGKGSVCNYLERYFYSIGCKVGLYTSPHLVDFNERIRLNCKNVSDKVIIDSFAEIEKKRSDVPLTFFEFTTLAAAYIFKSNEPDIIILEVGLGGRLDAVNIFHPNISIITSIDIDHVEYLGKTRELIGKEKAGIFRKNIPAIIGDKNPPNSVLDAAQKLNVPIYKYGVDFYFKKAKCNWEYIGKHCYKNLPFPHSKEEYELRNICSVITAVEIFKNEPLTTKKISSVITTSKFIGRFYKIKKNPSFIFDVSHNPSAIDSLAKNLKNDHYYKKTIGIFSIANNKDLEKVVKNIKPLIDIWCISDNNSQNLTKSDKIRICLIKNGISDEKIIVSNSFYESFSIAKKSSDFNDRIVIFGSFLLVGSLLKYVK